MDSGCVVCGVHWKPKSEDIWGPSISSLLTMKVKAESSEYKSFEEAAREYAQRHILRRPINSIGCLEETRAKKRGLITVKEGLQVIGNHFVSQCKQEEIPSFLVSDNSFHFSSYYKRILAKQHEMNADGDTTEYLHDPRLILVTPQYGVVFVRCLSVQDADPPEERAHRIKAAKIKLDKDSIFFWRLFQDIFKGETINFSGILALPNISNPIAEQILCRKCSKFSLFHRQLDSFTHFSEWCRTNLTSSTSDIPTNLFMEIVTRLAGLYVLIEAPQQNLDLDESDKTDPTDDQSEGRTTKHICKVLMTPQQYELLTSRAIHRVLFGEYGSGKTQLLIEKVRQTAWALHYAKKNSIIYLFSFADVEESGKLSLNECLLSHYLMSINKKYSEMITPVKDRFSEEILPPEIHVKVVIASMRQLVRLQEGATGKIKDIPGFLNQCIAGKVKQSPDMLIHIFIDEIPFSSFLDDKSSRWEEMISTLSPESNIWLTSRLPLYLWFQDDRDENSHVLTDFFLEELLRTNVTGSNMFYLPDSFKVSFFSQVMRSQKPILVLMREYYNLSQSAQHSFHAAKKKLARQAPSPSKQDRDNIKAKISGKNDNTPIWLPMPKCICQENPALKQKSDNKYCGCFVPRLAFIIDYMLSLLQLDSRNQEGEDRKEGEEKKEGNIEERIKLSDLLICCDTNSLHLLKRLGQALHIVDIDFVIYESDTWSNPHYKSEKSNAEDRLEASGSALGHIDKVLITTCLGSRGLEKKIVVYISPENIGDFLAIVKEKNFIEVVSRSINQVVIITVDDPKVGSLNPASIVDSIESVESVSWPNSITDRNSLDISGSLAGYESYSFVGLLKSLKHRGLLKETKLPMDEYNLTGLT